MAEVVELILIQIKSGQPTEVLRHMQIKRDSVPEVVSLLDENAM